MKNIILMGVTLASAVWGLTRVPLTNVPDDLRRPFHSTQEMAYFNKLSLATPVPDSIYFPTATYCKGCHGFDSLMHAMVTPDGREVNVFDDWEATMMANAAKDPFWRAKISHEILTNPAHSDEIQTKCTSCHAPMGHYTALFKGHDTYTIADLQQDTIGLDGISCGACHMISATNLGTTFSGELLYDTTRVMYGPYEAPFEPPMQNFVGFNPVYSPHINSADVCAPCHTLVTRSVDLQGNYTGGTFVEQATYHEWLNSTYSDPENLQTCQHCHMPRINDPVVISSNYAFLQPRTPYGLHTLVGANTMMLQLMKTNKAALGITASDANFDSTIAATYRLLREQTVRVELRQKDITPDTAFFEVDITNLAGHKFPSGYPSRRAVVQFVVLTESGDTLFQSGAFDNNYEVIGQHPQVTPHYNIITQPQQVQLYELVLGDITNQFTTLLERSYVALKDNRLPPLGFSTQHSAYDTTAIVGAALADEDFNKFNGVEGTGKDRIHYHVPLAGYTGSINVVAAVYYQSLPPKWLNPMLSISSPAIDSFREQYLTADRAPVLLQQDTLQHIVITSTHAPVASLYDAVTAFPNPAREGVTVIRAEQALIHEVMIFSLDGKYLLTQKGNGTSSVPIQLPESVQVAWLRIHTDKGWVLKKVVNTK